MSPLIHLVEVEDVLDPCLTWAEIEADAKSAGHALTLYRKGLALLTGEGVGQDGAAGVDHLARSARLGEAGAQTALGCAYWKGVGVAVDVDAASAWLSKANAGGCALARKFLADLIRERGAPKIRRHGQPGRREASA